MKKERERGRGEKEGGGRRRGERGREREKGKEWFEKNSKAKEQNIRVILFPFYSHGLLYIELCHRVIVNGRSGGSERHGKRRAGGGRKGQHKEKSEGDRKVRLSNGEWEKDFCKWKLSTFSQN